MSKFKNVEQFEKWCNKTFKKPFNMNAIFEELEEQYGNSGMSEFELSGHLTVSGKPECYSYDVENHYFRDDIEVTDINENDFDYAETTFVL